LLSYKEVIIRSTYTSSGCFGAGINLEHVLICRCVRIHFVSSSYSWNVQKNRNWSN